MTQTQARQLRTATQRAAQQHITIAARGTIKATGQRFFLVNGSTGAQYIVLVGTRELTCNCPAGAHDKLCKHRAAVRQVLLSERETLKAQQDAAGREAARKRETPRLRDTGPVKPASQWMWK